MKYRYLDEKDVGKTMAMDAERQAFILETASASDDENEDLKDQASKARKRADSLTKANKVNNDEVAGIHRAWLEERIQTLESEHVSHIRKLASKEGIGLNEKVKDQDGLSIEDHRDAIAIIEKAHEDATARLDAMPKAKTS